MQSNLSYIIFKLSFWVLLFIPLYFIIDGYRDIYINRRLMMEGIRVLGKVTAINECAETKGRNLDCYIYTVAYVLEDSVQRVVTLHKSTVQRLIGDEIFVYYLQNLPHIAKEKYNNISSKNIDSGLIVLIIFGGVIYFMISTWLKK